MANTKKRNSSGKRPTSFEVSVPGSTSNLGAGFDCFGLALKLYLTIRATIRPSAKEKCRVRTTGSRESAALPRNETNLIYRAMSFTAFRLGVELPPVDLAVHNDIPLASGLGSSAAAIVGGIKLCGLITGKTLDDKTILTYAAGFEGHPDNVSAALQGGLAVNSVDSSGEVLSVKINWPSHIKIVVVSPKSQLPTHVARAALARTVSRGDAVYNLQRSAMLIGAIAEHRYDLLWEAMKDRLHQPRRESLVPGLSEALSIKQTTGLLGVALSGAGPSIIALATDHEEEIAASLVTCFRKHGIKSTVRLLEADANGCEVRRSG
jgi:homoserine kinase